MKNKKKKVYVIMGLFFICGIILIVVFYNYKFIDFTSFGSTIYNEFMELNIFGEPKVEINYNNEILIGDQCKISIDAENNSDLVVNIYNNGIKNYNFLVNNENKENIIKVEINKKNVVRVDVLKNDELIYTKESDIYAISPYEHQFLEEKTSQLGMSTHFGLNYNRDEIDKSIIILSNLGIKNIRDDVLWQHVESSEGIYDYSVPNSWIPSIEEQNINILVLLSGGNSKQMGDDFQISNEQELENYRKYAENVINEYPNIEKFQIFNEPNDKWTSEEQKEWYAKSVIEVKKILENKSNKKVVNGSIAIQYQKENESIDYLKDIAIKYGTYNYSDILAYHMYTSQENMERLKSVNDYSIKTINEIGGFTERYINEFGITSTSDISEEERGGKLIKQYLTSINNGIKKCYLYDFRDTSSDINGTSRYGLLNYDYTPKDSYFIIKNFTINTNGAEYIGTLDIADGLEAHLYDKDGKPKVIAWATSTDKNVTLEYKDFTASDLYGEAIENKDGTITITTSPVYLDNVDYKLFYKSISKIAGEKYSEFSTDFADQINQLPDFKSALDIMKNNMSAVSSSSSVDENTAKQIMSNHYKLGDMLIEAVSDGTLDIEYVKLSSMLDSLNDIGNSYEDLVTVSAKTREADLTATNDLINKVDNIIESNSDLEIVYPSKISSFAKDLYDESNYINSLEEENDIKTGLIVSDNLHANLLAGWAEKFTQLYIDDYIKANPLSVTYSESGLTSDNVYVTLNIPSDVKITNNSGSNMYKFESNGKFTFEYTRRGQAYTYDVVVSNIDKVAPKVTGVANKGIYQNSITPVIVDDNLISVRVTLDGEEIPYKLNDTFTNPGIYVVEAHDTNGNNTTITFSIIEKLDSSYIVNDSYVDNINPNTTVETFKNNLKTSMTYKVIRYSSNDEVEVKSSETIATGDVLKVDDGGKEYKLVIKGDCNKDGSFDVMDLVKLRKYVANLEDMSDEEKQAADLNDDGKCDITDIVLMRKYLVQ